MVKSNYLLLYLCTLLSLSSCYQPAFNPVRPVSAVSFELEDYSTAKEALIEAKKIIQASSGTARLEQLEGHFLNASGRSSHWSFYFADPLGQEKWTLEKGRISLHQVLDAPAKSAPAAIQFSLWKFDSDAVLSLLSNQQAISYPLSKISLGPELVWRLEHAGGLTRVDAQTGQILPPEN